MMISYQLCKLDDVIPNDQQILEMLLGSLSVKTTLL